MKNMKSKNLNIWQKFGMFFYNRKRFTALLFIFLSGFGLLSYTNLMRREGFPSVNVPIGVVQAISIGVDAQTNDTKLADPIIKTAQSRPTVKKISTTATDQGVGVTIFFKSDTDVQSELDKIKEELSLKIPTTTQVLYIKVNSGKLTTEGDDLLVSIHSSSLSLESLDQQAEIVAKDLKDKIPMVAEVHIFKSFETVVNPETGQNVTRQIRFDRYYEADSGKILPSVIVGVTGNAGVDQLELFDQVQAYLSGKELENSGVDAEISANFAEGIREQISGLQRNLLEGLGAVLLVSFILISFRSSIATAVSMSTTVLITVGVLKLIDYSLNTITLFSLVLCLALIVDDTTIMVEAIDAGLKKGRKYKDVVSSAIRKVARASATGTLTTMLAFAPMLFIGGILGEFVRAIPVTIIISLAVSILVSFIFIPLIMRLTYGKVAIHNERKLNIASRIENTVGRGLARTLIWSDVNIKRRILMRSVSVVVGLGFLVGGGMIFTRVGFNIFPSPKDGVDITVSGQVINRTQAEITATEQITDRALSVVKEVLGKDLEKLTLTAQSGSADRYGFSANVTLSPIGSRDLTSVELAKEIQDTLDEKISGMNFIAESSGVGPPAGNFTVQIPVVEVDKSYELANDVKLFLESSKLVRPDGSTATIKNIEITPSNIIRREDGSRIILVSGIFSDKDTSTLVVLAQEIVRNEFDSDRLSSYGLANNSINFDLGQEEENQDSFSSMGKAAGPLFLAMFVVMALLFRSLLQPILILTALPFAIFGVASGLYLTANDISFFSMLGVFALIGISLNNTILLTDYANQTSKPTKRASEAMAGAIKERLRPLLTTSMTSILALLPLALNDPFWEGLAYTLIFGLISSTVLVLLVFPYYFLINNSIIMALKNIFGVVKSKLT